MDTTYAAILARGEPNISELIFVFHLLDLCCIKTNQIRSRITSHLLPYTPYHRQPRYNSHTFDFNHFQKQSPLQLVTVTAPIHVQMSPKLTTILDPMVSQTRSKLFIPDDPVTALPAKSKKTTPKPNPVTSPSSVSVLVETISTGDDTKPSTSASNDPGETVPASREVAQADITGGTAAFASASATGTTKNSTDNEDEDQKDNKQQSKIYFASMRDSRTTTASSAKKSGNNDSARNNDKKNKKNDKSGPTILFTFNDFFTLECRFIFDADPTPLLVAELINISYDLSFDPIILFYSDGSLQDDPALALCTEIRSIFSNQAIVTPIIPASARKLIIKTIINSFTFLSDMNKGKGLIKTSCSMYHVLLNAVR